MPVNITGAKYAVQTLSAVGTTTVTIGAAVFVQADFSTQRRVDLFSSTGVLKGHAFVRSWTSTTVLTLEDVFKDWKTGLAATQVVGDQVYVSKNFAESVVVGIAVSGNLVTLTDGLLFGTAGAAVSVTFHDENKNVSMTNPGGFFNQLGVQGGIVSFGHLQSWADKTYYNSCNFSSPITGNITNFAYATSTAARFYLFGGTCSVECYYGSGFNGSAAFGTDFGFFWTLGVQFMQSNILSIAAGGNWMDGTNHVLEGCNYVGGLNALMVRWGNGVVLGGNFKVLGNAVSIAIFGSDAAGTYPIGAPASKRAVVQDVGQGVLWRSSGTPVQTVNATNVISTDYRARNDAGAQPNVTVNVAFQDTYSNLVTGSTGAVVRNDTLAIVASVAGSIDTWSPVIPYDKLIGYTRQTGFPLGPWTFGVKSYGYAPLSGPIAAAPFPLGTAGTAVNVAFGGFLRQVADPAVTRTAAAALALSSKFTATAGTPGSVSVTASGTLDELYDYLIAWNCSTAALATFPTVSTYPVTKNGLKFQTAMNIVISAGAVLSAGTKMTTLATTGLVSGAGTISGNYTDSAADSFLFFDSIDSWTIFSDAARTIQLGAGTGLYRFNFVANTTYYINAVSGDTIFQLFAKPLAPGQYDVSLNTTAQLIALNAKTVTLAQLQANLWAAR